MKINTRLSAEDFLWDFMKNLKFSAEMRDRLVSEEFKDAIRSMLEAVEINKGEYFCEMGKRCNRIGILMNGLLYASYSADEVDEKVSRFFFKPDNMIITSFESFSTQTPSNESIIAIEKSHLLCLNYRNLQTLYDICPEFNYVGRLLAEQSYVQALRRVHFLQALNGKERVADFCKRYPDLLNRINKQHIGSYLNLDRTVFAKYLKGVMDN